MTTYLGAAAKVVKLPKKAATFIAGRVGKASRAAGKSEQRAVRAAEHAPHPAIEASKPAEITNSRGARNVFDRSDNRRVP